MKRFLTLLAALLLLPTAAFAQFTTTQGGTGTSSPSGMLYGDSTIRLKSVKLGSNITFSGGTLSFTDSNASSTLLSDNNTFSGIDLFTNSSSNFSGTWQTFSPSHFQTALSGTGGQYLIFANGAWVGAATSTFSSPLSFNAGTNAVSIQAASATQNGYMSSFDWQLLHTATTTFSSPLVYTGSTNAVTCPTCGAGTVTSITGGTGLSGGTITVAGTLSLLSYFGTSTADTTGRVLYWNSTNATPALFTSSANMTFDGTKLTLLAASTTNESISNFFQAPNGTSITLGTAGTVAVNTTAASTSIQAYGAAQMGAYQTNSVSWSYPTSTPTGTTTLFIQLGPRGQTFTSMACDTDTGTVLVVIGTGSASSTIVLASSTAAVSVALSSNNTFNAWQRFYISMGSWTTTATGVVTCGFGRKYDY